MIIYQSVDEFAKTGYESCVALGFFDGVHLGHRQVVRECCKKKNGRMAVVLTFGESPSAILKKTEAALLTDNEEKARLLEEAGADAVIFEDFRRVREMSAREFVCDVLRDRLRAKKVCCGYNYRFSKNGAGDSNLLGMMCEEEGIETAVVEPVYCDGEAVSSTAIRAYLAQGEIEKANRMLGYAYTVRGPIGEGNHLGTGLGFPTVNLGFSEKIAVPRFGVYASRITVGGRTYRGATNIGVHPTVGSAEKPVCETFIIGYDGGELYGHKAACALERFLRPEREFGSQEELVMQVREDIALVHG